MVKAVFCFFEEAEEVGGGELPVGHDHRLDPASQPGQHLLHQSPDDQLLAQLRLPFQVPSEHPPGDGEGTTIPGDVGREHRKGLEVGEVHQDRQQQTRASADRAAQAGKAQHQGFQIQSGVVQETPEPFDPMEQTMLGALHFALDRDRVRPR